MTRKGRPPVEVILVLTNPRGWRLSEIQGDYLGGTKSEEGCLNEIMVIVTTAKPLRSKKARQRWAVRRCQRYYVRWQIETGFRDVKQMAPSSNSRTNNRKLLMFSLRFWGLNLWQIARAGWWRQKRQAKCRRRGPKLRSFAYDLEMQVLEVPVL